jgi:hypothetical protein
MLKTASEIADQVLVKVAESMDFQGTPEEFRDFQLRNIRNATGPLMSYATGMGALGGAGIGSIARGTPKASLIGAGIGAGTGLATALGARAIDKYRAENKSVEGLQSDLEEHQALIQDLRDKGHENFEISPNAARNRLIASSILSAMSGAGAGGLVGNLKGRAGLGAGIGALSGAGAGLGLGAIGNAMAREGEAEQEKLSSIGRLGRSVAQRVSNLRPKGLTRPSTPGMASQSWQTVKPMGDRVTESMRRKAQEVLAAKSQAKNLSSGGLTRPAAPSGATPGAEMQSWYTTPLKSVEDRVAGAMRIKAQEALKANQHRMVPGSARV